MAANAHESVAAGTPLMAVLDDRSLEIKLIVPSPWLAWLRPSTEFDITIDETSRAHAGRVTKIGARIDPVSQTVAVWGAFAGEAPPDGLIAGMSGTAAFRLPPTD